MLGWILAIGIFLALLVLDAFLGGFTGAVVGVLCWLVFRRGPWERVVPMDMLLGSAAFALAEIGVLILGSQRAFLQSFLGAAPTATIMSLYEHNFRVGFVAAAAVPILYEVYLATTLKKG